MNVWFAPWKSAFPLMATIELGPFGIFLDLNAWGLYAIFGDHNEVAVGPLCVTLRVPGPTQEPRP